MARKQEPRYEVECESKSSIKCKGRYTVSRHRYKDIINSGKCVCFYCSMNNDFSGRDNPASTHTLDDNALANIDTEAKAYLLGWIASDGSIVKNVIHIELHKKDKYILSILAEILNSDSKVIHRSNRDTVYITFCSKQLVTDICRHLKIEPKKKSHIVRFPDSLSEDLGWAFLRGYFDGDGTIRRPIMNKSPECAITSNSTAMLEDIKTFCGIPSHIYEDNITWTSNNALDFMSKLYDNANSKLILMRKWNRYQDWCVYVPALQGHYGRSANFRWSRTNINAVPPTKAHASDSGYDLTAINLLKTVGKVTYYDTGIKLFPDYGWYFHVYQRSSLTKSGYTLANAVGIIDRGYTGSVILALYKFDPSMPDLQLPAKVAQAIPMPTVHFTMTEVTDISMLNTTRSDGGFGSSDKKG